jgi:AcrR family transcriptional regulator
VRQSHLTYYFPTRDALLEAVTAEAVGAMACEVRGAVAEIGDDGDRWLERLAVSVAELEHMRMFVAMIVEADGDASIRALIVAATRRMEAVVAEAIGGADAAQRARLVLAAVWGLGLYHFVMRPEDDSADFIGSYVSWLRMSSIL